MYVPASEIAQIITALATLIASIATAIIGLRNAKKIRRIEELTNGLKDELVDEVRASAHARGHKRGVEDEHARRNPTRRNSR